MTHEDALELIKALNGIDHTLTVSLFYFTFWSMLYLVTGRFK